MRYYYLRFYRKKYVYFETHLPHSYLRDLCVTFKTKTCVFLCFFLETVNERFCITRHTIEFFYLTFLVLLRKTPFCIGDLRPRLKK